MEQQALAEQQPDGQALAIREDNSSITHPGLIRPVASPKELVEAHKEAVGIIKDVLEDGRDYGTIPGTGDKATLLKPGAERLLTAFGAYADPMVVEQECDHDRVNSFELKKWEMAARPSDDVMEKMKAQGIGRWRKGQKSQWIWQEAVVEQGESIGLYRFVVKCNIVLRQTGTVIASGVGACSSLESKYIRSPRDYENTVLKMAKKRAMVDAVLNAFGLSDRFTQDIEDIGQTEPAEKPNNEQQNGAAKPKQNTAPIGTPDPMAPLLEALKKLGLNPSEHHIEIAAALSTYIGRPILAIHEVNLDEIDGLVRRLGKVHQGEAGIPPDWVGIVKTLKPYVKKTEAPAE